MVALGAGVTNAEEPTTDTWLGRDKAMHFAASAGIAALSYRVTASAFDDAGSRLLAAGGLTLGIGVGKELQDLLGDGDPSWKDLAWDVLGTGAGLFAAWMFETYVMRPWLRFPPVAADRQPLLRRGFGIGWSAQF